MTNSFRYVLIGASDQCDTTTNFSAGITFTSEQGFDVIDENNNGKYICAKAEDKVGNIGYKKSTNPLNIDRTAPVVTF